MTELYWMQVSEGRYYLHEHPKGASSWRCQCIVDLIAADPHAELATCYMCCFGMEVRSRDGLFLGRAKKPTQWLTNAPAIAGNA